MGRLTLDWLHIVVLLGAVQGIFLAGALATKRRNRTANRVLAVAMLAFSFHLASSVHMAAGLVPVYPHFFGLAYPLPFLYGPLVYLYAVTAADRGRGFRRWDALHFVPFLATLVAGAPIYLMSGPEKVAFYQDLQNGARPLLIQVADPLKLASGVIYASLTIVFLQRHRERVKESYSSTERVNLRWLFWLGIGAAAIWSLAVAFDVLASAGLARVERADDFVALAIAVLLYGIGYRGMRQPEIFRYETAEYPVVVQQKADTKADMTEDIPPDMTADMTADTLPNVTPRYERSGLGDREAQRLKGALLAVMDGEHPWKDSELTLAELAARLDTTPHKLSEVLNSQIGQTFYDFVNGYRVREVQRRIAAGEAQRLKMLSLAMDAGFSSKSTFNQVFKKHTSQTPSNYRQAAGA